MCVAEVSWCDDVSPTVRLPVPVHVLSVWPSPVTLLFSSEWCEAQFTQNDPVLTFSLAHSVALCFVSCVWFISWRSVCFKHSGRNFQRTCWIRKRNTSFYGAILHLCMSPFWHLTFKMFHLWEKELHRLWRDAPWKVRSYYNSSWGEHEWKYWPKYQWQPICRDISVWGKVDGRHSCELILKIRLKSLKQDLQEKNLRNVPKVTVGTIWSDCGHCTDCDTVIDEDGQKRDCHPAWDSQSSRAHKGPDLGIVPRIPLLISNVRCQGSDRGQGIRGDGVGTGCKDCRVIIGLRVVADALHC